MEEKKSVGRPRQSSKRKVELHATIDPGVMEQIKLHAETKKISKSQIVNELLANALGVKI